MSEQHQAIERSGNFVDLFDDASPPTPDDASVTITGERLDTEEKIRAFFVSVGLSDETQTSASTPTAHRRA